jgi:hypothetical protein
MWSQQNGQWYRHSRPECFDQDAGHGDGAEIYIFNVLMINDSSACAVSSNSQFHIWDCCTKQIDFVEGHMFHQVLPKTLGLLESSVLYKQY